MRISLMTVVGLGVVPVFTTACRPPSRVPKLPPADGPILEQVSPEGTISR